MKIHDVFELSIPEIRVIQFARFRDDRGYFTEHYRRSDFEQLGPDNFMSGIEFVQMNMSFSRAGTIRGLHFQWNPYMGKLVRTLQGRMVDLVLDIRRDSPTFGQAIACDMPADPDADIDQWIWVPPGFAHGNYFPEDTTIEYLCSGEYSPGCEAGISPFSRDIDWSPTSPDLVSMLNEARENNPRITDKDRNGLTLEQWAVDPRSDHFLLSSLDQRHAVGASTERQS